jgi:hypothetical protein
LGDEETKGRGAGERKSNIEHRTSKSIRDPDHDHEPHDLNESEIINLQFAISKEAALRNQ